MCVLALLALAPSTSFAQSVPSPWTARDIGQPTAAGSSSFNQGTFSITGSGLDIWGNFDQFQFAYQQVVGDVEIIARVNSLSPTNEWSKAGVMIRSSLNVNAAYAFTLVSPGWGTAFQRRAADNGAAVHTAGSAATAPRWVRVTRAGAVLTSYESADGQTWSQIGSDSIALGATAYVGMAVTSHSNGALAVANISQVTVRALSLPSTLQTQDIGSPQIPGSTTVAGGTYSVTASGADIWDLTDHFRYVYQPINGDVDVVARVASLAAADGWAKSGVMIRETLADNSRHAMAIVTPQSGYAFQRRVDTASFSANTYGGAGGAPQWVRLIRTGSQFQALRSADGVTWTPMGTDTIPMGAPAYVGMALTGHSLTATATAVFDNFKVSGVQSPPNQPPLVTLTQPPNGASYAPGASIPVAATASDPENRMNRVEFFSGTTRIASDPTSPYSTTWSSTAAGTYSLFAVAYDNDGGSTTSTMSTISVAAASTPPRLVIFGASPDHNTLVTSYRLDIFAGGANPNSATPLTTSNLGKPAPDGAGDITVDRATFFSALASGSYVATVSAVGPGGEGRGAAVNFTR